MKNNGDIELINCLIKKNHSLATLADEMQVSKKTIQNTIVSLNEIYDDLIFFTKDEIQIDMKKVSKIKLEYKKMYSREERRDAIFILINTGLFTIQDLTNIFFRSEKTIYKDVNIVKAYQISLSKLQELYYKIDNSIIEIVTDCLKNSKYDGCTKKRLDSKILILNLIYNKNSKKIKRDFNIEEKFKVYHQVIKKHYKFLNEEIIDLIIPFYLIENRVILEDDYQKAMELYNLFILNLRKYGYIPQYDKKTFKYHILHSYYNYYFHLPIDEIDYVMLKEKNVNHLAGVKEIGTKILSFFPNLEISDIEMFYISIHFTYQEKKKKIFICSKNGFSKGIIIKNQLEKYYGDIEVLEICTQEYALDNIDNVDYIISDYEILNYKNIKINLIFELSDFQKLNKYFNFHVEYSDKYYEYYTNLKPYLKEDIKLSEFILLLLKK